MPLTKYAAAFVASLFCSLAPTPLLFAVEKPTIALAPAADVAKARETVPSNSWMDIEPVAAAPVCAAIDISSTIPADVRKSIEAAPAREAFTTLVGVKALDPKLVSDRALLVHT